MAEDSSFHIAKSTKVKRGSFWSSRLVNWKNDELFYFKSEKDTAKPRFEINLRTCQVFIAKSTDRPPIMILSQKGEDILRIDLASDKFANMIVGKLSGIGIQVNELGKKNDATERLERKDSAAGIVPTKKPSMETVGRRNSMGDDLYNEDDAKQLFQQGGRKRSYMDIDEGLDKHHTQHHHLDDDNSSEEDDDQTAFSLSVTQSDSAKAYFALKNLVRENMVFIDRRSGVSVYGVHEDKGLGFRQLRRMKQLREVITKIIALRKYELGFYMIFVFALLFSIMSFGQILFFSASLAGFLWLTASILVHPQANYYYLKKDIKINTKHSSHKSKPFIGSGRHTDLLDLDESFGEEMAAQVMSKHTKPHHVFKAMQGILLKLLVVHRRKRFMPFISKCEVKGQILKLVTEDGQNRYFIQHFLKHGKHHFAAVETEKFTNQIHYVYELKFIPKTKNVVLSVFMRESDSRSALAAVDALSRELALGCEEEETLRSAVDTAYFKVCEFIPKNASKREEINFEQLKSAEAPESELQPVKEEELAEATGNPKRKDSATLAKEQPGKEENLTKSPSSLQQDEVGEDKLSRHALLPREAVATPVSDKEGLSPPSSVLVQEKESPSQQNLPVVTQKVKDEGVAPVTPSDGGEQTPVKLEGAGEVTPSEEPQTPRPHYGLTVTPAIPEHSLKLFEEKHKMLSKMLNTNNGRWKEGESKNGLKVYEDSKDDFVRLLSIYKVPYTIEELMPFMKDPAFRLRYDELLKSVEFLHKYSEEIGIIRVVIKGQFPVSDREFITYIALTMPDENTLIAISYDATDFEYPKSKAVRGELELSASVLKRLPNNETEFTMVASSDPKLKGVPNSIIRAKSRQTAMAPVQFYEILKKDKLIKPRK